MKCRSSSSSDGGISCGDDKLFVMEEEDDEIVVVVVVVENCHRLVVDYSAAVAVSGCPPFSIIDYHCPVSHYQLESPKMKKKMFV